MNPEMDLERNRIRSMIHGIINGDSPRSEAEVIKRKNQLAEIHEYLERAKQSVGETSDGQGTQSEAVTELRSDRAENGTPSTLPSYEDIHDDVDDDGPKPSELYGKKTLMIEKFSENNKRELHSDVFEVGGLKWCILINPREYDVANHLSVCLSVANHDELPPGWSHFAQFTIAVLSKDSKKFMRSDPLHRFCKKEYAWGCEKFMELPELQEGFIDDSGSLKIKAQIQVIRDRVDRPFRCLHSWYKRELVHVYLRYVEQICWRFLDERRSKFGSLIGDNAKWESLCAFWNGLDQNSRRQMSQEKLDIVLRSVVKHFFIEKEVTSTLLMDSLYSGLKAFEGQTLIDSVTRSKDMFLLVGNMPVLVKRAAREPSPLKDEMPLNSAKGKNAREESCVQAVEREERRLTELARQTLEMFVLGHIFSNKIEVSYQDAIALKRQEALIREEEAWKLESEGKAKEAKKSKKKQKKNKKKEKEKNKDKKVRTKVEETDMEKEEHLRVHSSEVHRVEEVAAAISPIREPESPRERNHVSKDRDTVPMQEKSVSVLSSPRAAPWNPSSLVQTKPEKKVATNVDYAPKRKPMSAKSAPSVQTSPSRATQLQTVGSRIPLKQASPVIPPKQASPVIPPKQASPATSVVQTSKASLARSKSSTGHLSSPTHGQPYIPQSYKHAVVGSSGFDHSSSQSTGVSTLLPYSHPSPISVSNQSGFPIKVGSADVSSGGFLWTGGSTSDSRTSGNHGMNQYNHPVVASTRPTDVHMGRAAQSLMTDEFPHVDIINDLLKEEHDMMGMPTDVQLGRATQSLMMDEFPHVEIINDLLEEEHGMMGRPTGVQLGRATQSLMSDEFPHLDIINDLLQEERGMMGSRVYHVPQVSNNQYMYHGDADLGISGRSRSYNDDGFHQSYGEYMQHASSPYRYEQVDELANKRTGYEEPRWNQWV